MARYRNRRRTALYLRIQNIAGSVLHSYICRGLFPKLGGTCVDCGGAKFLCYEHRNYDDAMSVEVVCQSCNEKRGYATFSVLDPDTLTTVVPQPFVAT